jgi:hypothetical protein
MFLIESNHKSKHNYSLVLPHPVNNWPSQNAARVTVRNVELLVQNTITLFNVLPRSRDLARTATRGKVAQELDNILHILATNLATYVPVCHHVTNHHQQLFPD